MSTSYLANFDYETWSETQKSEKLYLDFESSGVGLVKYHKIVMGKPNQLLLKSESS